jgi:DNA uptake protein ComE-like DNA-binding protein
MTMDRRGFALITVLWLITALSAVVGLSLGAVRLGQRTSLNRTVLTRGRWAAEACIAIAQPRWIEHRLADSATIDLGRGTWCRWRVDDPTSRVNVNTADREVLQAVAGRGGQDLVDSIMSRRRAKPFVDLAEIPGLDERLVTVDGPGVVNLGAAPREVLQALPGLAPEAVDRLTARRAMGRPIGSLDELAALLSPGAREALLTHYADLARRTTFAAPQLVVTVEGGIGGQALRSTIELLVVPLANRLAVVRRRMW